MVVSVELEGIVLNRGSEFGAIRGARVVRGTGPFDQGNKVTLRTATLRTAISQAFGFRKARSEVFARDRERCHRVSTGLRKNQPKIIVLRLDERRKADIIGDGLRASKSLRLLRGITVGSKKPSSPRKNDGEK